MITVAPKTAAIPAAPAKDRSLPLHQLVLGELAAFLIGLSAVTKMRPASPGRTFAFALLLALIVAGAWACGGGGGTTGPPPPVVTLQANPPSITYGASSTLSWTSANATQVSISPNVGSVPLQGSATVSPTSSTTYTIAASGPGGSESAATLVTVSTPPSIVVAVTVQANSPSVNLSPGVVTITIP
jgi:hypothetical protein